VLKVFDGRSKDNSSARQHKLLTIKKQKPMSAHYKILENPQPEPDKQPISYHARYIPTSTVRINQLCKEISEMSTFTSGDIKGIIEALSNRIIFHLEYGEDLDIEGLGHFTVSLDCDQPQNGERHTAVHVHFKTVKFRCCKNIKEKLRWMHFEPVPKEDRYSGLSPERRRRNILNYLSRRNVVQSSDCMAINNCSRYMAIKDLKALMEEGKIIRLGHKKSAMYRLSTAVETE